MLCQSGWRHLCAPTSLSVWTLLINFSWQKRRTFFVLLLLIIPPSKSSFTAAIQFSPALAMPSSKTALAQQFHKVAAYSSYWTFTTVPSNTSSFFPCDQLTLNLELLIIVFKAFLFFRTNLDCSPRRLLSLCGLPQTPPLLSHTGFFQFLIHLHHLLLLKFFRSTLYSPSWELITVIKQVVTRHMSSSRFEVYHTVAWSHHPGLSPHNTYTQFKLGQVNLHSILSAAKSL